ncbi:MAG: CHAT domain-containing protein, partial [Cyanobacteria bacterium J06555_13]
IEIEGESPEFHALHWEALKDPKHPTPLSVECLFTRKRFHQGLVGIDLKPSSTINLLVVTARPDEENDVGYRTISRPLIETIQQAQLRVNVELLRPGTFQALSDHLEGKEGYYHIVHFDTHGGLMTYEQFQTEVEKGNYIFQRRWGRVDLERYKGRKAFLFLEGANKGQADPVEAKELANLLKNKGIPACILNACQSGKQARSESSNEPLDTRETSLGSELMTAGVQMVIAMGYSVTVTAAALMMKKLYGQIFSQTALSAAVRLSRKTLYNNKDRKVYFNQIEELEDWLLPVVYANHEVTFPLLEAEDKDKLSESKTRRMIYQSYEPTYGFVGRDLEILKIEKSLLQHNILLLRGMGGAGKTTLLKYLRRWWEVTNFALKVFYFGYDERAHTLQQILQILARQLYSAQRDISIFEAMPIEDQMQNVAQTLRSSHYALMLDNLESITGQALAIQNTLSEIEQKKLEKFLKLLRGGKTKVILGSRSGEEWLLDTFQKDGCPNLYVLSGLDPESTSVLAEKILKAKVKDSKKIEAIRREDGFNSLITLLAGYPLAMEVILGNLARQSTTEVLAGLSAKDIKGLDTGGMERTNNILRCVEYSYGYLSADTKKALLCLAPFNNFINRAGLETYRQNLESLVPLQEYSFRGLNSAITEAIQWGLMSSMSTDQPDLLNIQPVFPYFLRTKVLELDVITRSAIYGGFATHYQSVASSYGQMLESQDAQERHTGAILCRLEYENLYNALKICLENYTSIQPFFCLFLLFRFEQDIQNATQLSEFVCNRHKSYPSEVQLGLIGYEIVNALDRLAYCYLESRNYQKAKSTYKRILELAPQLREISEELKRSVILAAHH